MPGIVLLVVCSESDWLLPCLILGKTCFYPVFAVIFRVYGISGMEGLFYQLEYSIEVLICQQPGYETNALEARGSPMSLP